MPNALTLMQFGWQPSANHLWHSPEGKAWALAWEDLGPGVEKAFASGCPDRMWGQLSRILAVYAGILGGEHDIRARKAGKADRRDAAPCAKQAQQAPSKPMYVAY